MVAGRTTPGADAIASTAKERIAWERAFRELKRGITHSTGLHAVVHGRDRMGDQAGAATLPIGL